MANSLYTKARVAFLSGQIDMLGDTVKAALVSGDYTPNFATDEFYADLSAFVVGTPQTIENIAITEPAGDALVDGDDVLYEALTGDPVSYVAIYQDTGDESTSRLILLMDTAAGLPLIPNGTNVPLVWSASGIFSWLGC